MKRHSKRPGRPSGTQRFLEANLGPVKQYVHRLSAMLALNPELPIVLVNRVSTRPQAAHGNLAHDKEWCMKRLKGCNVIKQFDEVCSGRLGNHRTVLRAAIAYAHRHGAVVVVSSRERLLRAAAYDGTNASDVPGHDEYQSLAKLADGVQFATILRPTQRGRSFQIRRGQEARRMKGGRPKRRQKPAPGYKRERRRELLSQALKLRDEGLSVRSAARELDVPPKTIHDWWHKY